MFGHAKGSVSVEEKTTLGTPASISVPGSPSSTSIAISR